MKIKLGIWLVSQFSTDVDSADSPSFAFEWLAKKYIEKKFPTGAYYEEHVFEKTGPWYDCIGSWIHLKWVLFRSNVVSIWYV